MDTDLIIEGEVSIEAQVAGDAQLSASIDGEADCMFPDSGGGGSAVIEELNVTDNGSYTAPSGVDGYSPVNVDVPVGLIIPEGFAYYNGNLLPKIPTGDGYDYTFIRKNENTGNWDCIQGKGQWRSRSNATLDNWALEFATQSTYGSRQYSIPIGGTDTGWGDYVSSTNYYGTTLNRKVVWASHDIMIGSTGNILFKHTDVIYPA